MITTNFHTHTSFCDGKNTPEEMVLAAIAKGFTALGFSGHCDLYLPCNEYSMTEESEPLYRKEVERLKQKYRDIITIYCGAELDYYSVLPKNANYDYLIGSVHFILKNGKYIPVDLSVEETLKAVNEIYGGDFDSYAEDFFALEADVLNKTNADIIGHLDIVSKYSEITGYTPSDRYLAAAEKAVKSLVAHKKPFEINTGAISKGYRTTPFPSAEILKMIKGLGGKIMIASDCHDKDFLDCAFDKAVNLAINCGFSEYGIITKDGIKYIPF